MVQVREISPKDLKDWQEAGREYQLVDIREAHEVAVSTLGGLHIPMAFCLARQHLIRRDIPVVVHCRSGARAAAVVSALEQKGGFDNLYNLRGGIEGWAREVAPEMEVG
jgi:adenylyltransferase/sulfurtransferase